MDLEKTHSDSCPFDGPVGINDSCNCNGPLPEPQKQHIPSCSFSGPVESFHSCACGLIQSTRKNVFEPEPESETSPESSSDGLELTRQHISVLTDGEKENEVLESPDPNLNVLDRKYRVPNIHRNGTKTVETLQEMARKPLPLIIQFQTACEEAIRACANPNPSEAEDVLNTSSKKIMVIFMEFQQMCKDASKVCFETGEAVRVDNNLNPFEETDTNG